MNNKYDHLNIEPKWQAFWEDNKTFKVELDLNKPKYYILDMFPYPSGQGLHVGHPLGYTATDILSRYKRMRGFNVLHPMGWDAFGLPAEQYAVETGTHPANTTKKNIEIFKSQIKSLGFSYDWDREINTTDPKYYKWTQWIFLQLYKKGLAYQDEVPVNWCPELGTVLANEEVIDGKSERGGHPVIRKPMKQWVFRITDYADSLLKGLEDVDWPDNVKELQRNWIGKSDGSNVIFDLPSISETISVFTTRPDTLFGATYMVLAPEHPLVDILTKEGFKNDVLKYVEITSHKSDLDRGELNKDKTGVFIGSYAINPLNNEEIPIWISDYVLMSYGTGAIMAVPGHDQRDYEFAQKFDLPIMQVVSGGNISNRAFTDIDKGVMINSSKADGSFSLNDLTVKDAIEETIAYLEKNNKGERAVEYKLRDWLFSRQRYWGEPFPIIHIGDKYKAVLEEELPVLLPDVDKYEPTGTGESPLAAIDSWVNTTDKETGENAKRETHTMPQWAGSCWYYLRFLDPNNDDRPWDKEVEKYWMPVDLYVGGIEHAVLHLLYSRFWHHVLYDLGLVSTREPYKKLFNQGMIQGEDGQKMSKSRGNVINPDDIINEYGADSMRLYEMFMGPLDKSKPWSTKGLQGCARFAEKVWRIYSNADKYSEKPDSEETIRLLHQTIAKVTNDLDNMRFNTAISQMMIFSNHVQALEQISTDTLKTFLLLLNPFIPHMAEEINEHLNAYESISYAEWPNFDAELAKEDLITIAIQVNGKLRGNIQVKSDIDDKTLKTEASNIETVKKHLDGREIIKKIVVPGRLVNFVVK
ncbi:MAG: leucine--tRNA ligase [Candidatus Neomarinimicrobiota bacterium]|nr:leucine--tRNA ligase [Candidatus Neomarinimicrobiota bacterium]